MLQNRSNWSQIIIVLTLTMGHGRRVLTVNAQCNGCLVLFSILHGTVEHNTLIANTIVVFRWRDGQRAGCLMILRTSTIYDGLQRCCATVTEPSGDIESDKKNVNLWFESLEIYFGHFLDPKCFKQIEKLLTWLLDQVNHRRCCMSIPVSFPLLRQR